MATYISIHTAFAGCDAPGKLFREDDYISIHTAFAGCDQRQHVVDGFRKVFQSTQPSQAVTLIDAVTMFSPGISIHTAFAGCDYTTIGQGCQWEIFQSTQPSQAVTCRRSG